MAVKSGWRETSKPIIAKIIAANPGKTEKELRALIRPAYPFYEREHHPYKIWCDEVSRQIAIALNDPSIYRRKKKTKKQTDDAMKSTFPPPCDLFTSAGCASKSGEESVIILVDSKDVMYSPDGKTVIGIIANPNQIRL